MLHPTLKTGVAALLAAAVTLGAPAAAQAGIPTCPAQPTAQVFLPWADPAWYASVPDGGFEGGGAGWALGGATVVDGNEPYFVRAAGDRRSLALPGGASAASAATCIGAGHPTLRFFVRSTGAPLARLRVSAEFADALGVQRSLPVAVLTGTPGWSATPVLPVAVSTISALNVHQVRFRFAASGGDWAIDDVYVDPYGKG